MSWNNLGGSSTANAFFIIQNQSVCCPSPSRGDRERRAEHGGGGVGWWQIQCGFRIYAARAVLSDF